MEIFVIQKQQIREGISFSSQTCLEFAIIFGYFQN